MLHALCITLLAGLSTGVGGLIVLVSRRPSAGMMAFSMGFAGGVMTAVSLADMLPEAVEGYAQGMPVLRAALAAGSLCAAGMAVAWALGRCIPEQPAAQNTLHGRALRSAMVTTAALVLHNLPEGILTLFTGYADPHLGATMALAIALHNLPEGIAVAVPVCYATGSRARGILYALASGLAEPVGALLAFWLLRGWLTARFLDGLVATIAGVMLYVSLGELLPESFSYGERGTAVAGACVGVVLMHTGLYLF